MNRKKINVELYKRLYLIRRAEEKIRELYHEDEMKTPMHMSMGGEAIAVGVCAALDTRDQVFGTYRSHASYIAKTGDVNKFFAELYGKDSGIAKGKAGSMHLSYVQKGFLGTSAVVGTTIPAAVGAAFANLAKENRRLAAVLFGDGAVDEGVFWESLNLACLKQIPVLFVCEDNGLAIHTSTSKRRGYNSLIRTVGTFNCSVFESVTTDVEQIYLLTKKAIKHIRNTLRPAFLNLKYYRYLEHVGVNEDFDAGYRSRRDFVKWQSRDPLSLERRKLLKLGLREETIVNLESAINSRIETAVRLAKSAKFTKPHELYTDIFS